MLKQCKQCGYISEAENSFCTKCGNSLESSNLSVRLEAKNHSYSLAWLVFLGLGMIPLLSYGYNCKMKSSITIGWCNIASTVLYIVSSCFSGTSIGNVIIGISSFIYFIFFIVTIIILFSQKKEYDIRMTIIDTFSKSGISLETLDDDQELIPNDFDNSSKLNDWVKYSKSIYGSKGVAVLYAIKNIVWAEYLEQKHVEQESFEKKRLERERLEQERLEKERLEKERLEKERLENERLEKERLEKERLEREQLEKERLVQEHLMKKSIFMNHPESETSRNNAKNRDTDRNDLIVCANCGNANESNARYCYFCGSEIEEDAEYYCANCKKSVNKDDEYCPYCGLHFDDSVDDSDDAYDNNDESSYLPAVSPTEYVKWADDTFRKCICTKYKINGSIQALRFQNVLGLRIQADEISCITDKSNLDPEKRGTVNYWISFNSLATVPAIRLGKCLYSSLEDLKYFYNLTHLSLQSYGLPDLTPIRYLHNLKELYISSCYLQIVSLAPLYGFGIESLIIEQSIINSQTVSELADILGYSFSITYFEMSGCSNGKKANDKLLGISDVSFIKNATCLETLVLSSLEITDLSFLKKCRGLDVLRVTSCKVNDISGLKDYISLSTLDLHKNRITDIACFASPGISSIDELNLSDNLISDMTPLSKLTIRILNVENNRVYSLAWAQDILSLEELYISNEQLDSVKWIKNLPNLKLLSVRNVGPINRIKLAALANERPDIEIKEY